MDLRKVSIPLCAVALAACGGGGGDSGTSTNGSTGAVVSMTADVTELRAFVGAVKTLNIYATDIQGTLIAAPALTWSSSSTAVATAAAGTAPSTGTITAIGAGASQIGASSNGRTLTVPMTVYAAPTAVSDLQKVFPYAKTNGTVSTFSDMSSSGNDERYAHMLAFWTYMTDASNANRLLPASPRPSSVEFYFTRDNTALIAGRTVCNMPAYTTPPAVGSIMSCPDGGLATPPATTTERWFYVSPSNPLSQDKAQMQHEVSEAFFERAVGDEKAFPWLYKGSTLFHEAGVLNGSTFTVNAASLKARLAADPVNNRMTSASLSTILNAPYETAGGIEAIHSYSYGPAGVMLFLWETYRAQLSTLMGEVIAGIDGDGAPMTTNAASRARLQVLTGKSLADLDGEYLAWRTTQGL